MPEITYEFPEEADMTAFWEDPSKASEGMQKKYIGMTKDEYDARRDSLQDTVEALWQNEQYTYTRYTNVFTKEEKNIKSKTPLMVLDNVDIEWKILELKKKVALWIATAEERETLALLK